VKYIRHESFGFWARSSNPMGNLLAQTIRRGSWTVPQSYAYDGRNRLSRVTEPGQQRTFGYSGAGNMWVSAWQGSFAPGGFTPASAAWFDGNNRMVNTGLGIQYDAAGNLTAIGGFTFGYDAEGRLVSSTLNGVTAAYAYDGEGRRVKKSAVVLVYDAFGRLAAEYGGVADPVGTEYLTADHLGSTRLVTSATGAERRCLDYLPFGEQMVEGMGSRGACYASANEPRVKFTGKERDSETGLDYFGARYFSGAQGRFTSPDPLMASARASDPQSWNRYAYVLNNPLKFVDPDGLEVPDSCVKDQNCTIVIKLNVVYDATMNRGRGPNQQQRQKWEKEQLAKAQKDYGHSNIKLEATYTPGRYDVGSDGQTPILRGLNPDALNVMVSQGTPTNKAGVSYLDQNGPVSIININDAIAGNWSPFGMNTTAHELGHHFLGDVGTRPRGEFDVLSKEYDVDNRLLMQGVGRSQQDFREGVKQKRYAVPLNPEANKPRQ
jgi:RHS repeat-associated protein